MKKSGFFLFLPLALLVLPVGLVLVGQADGGSFAASAVVPTADEVSVGEEVGFALYIVNSGPPTATEVLVWNPLPPGTTYVSASGGAFPVVGGMVSGVTLTEPPEGYAYDARLRAPVPLTDTETVTGIAWVGDIPPGEMATPGLIVRVETPAMRDLVDEMYIYDDRTLAGRFSGQTWVRPFRRYLPLVGRRFAAPVPPPTTTTMTFTIPYGQGLGTGGGSLDEDYQQALTGTALNFGDGDVYLGQAPPDGPYLPWYVIGRAYVAWDTSSLPDGAEIVSATLVLKVDCNPPTTTFGATVYRGLWTPPLSEDAWYAMGTEAVGDWDTADYPCSGHIGSGLVRIPLDPAVVNRNGLTLLEMRSDREGAPPTTPEQVLLNRSPDFPALVVVYREEAR